MQGTLKAMQVLHNDVGRSVEEAMRLLDAFQYVEENGVVRFFSFFVLFFVPSCLLLV